MALCASYLLLSYYLCKVAFFFTDVLTVLFCVFAFTKEKRNKEILKARPHDSCYL